VLLLTAGDAGKVTVGSGSNLQDGTVVRTHETRLGPDVLPGPHPNTVIGDNVTIGHQVPGRSFVICMKTCVCSAAHAVVRSLLSTVSAMANFSF